MKIPLIMPKTGILKMTFYTMLTVVLSCGNLHADTNDPQRDSPEKITNITIKSENPEAADFLLKIINPIAEQAAYKFEGLAEDEELPMNIHDPEADCSEYETSLWEYHQKMTTSLTEITDSAAENNNELGVWGKLKALNFLRMLFQYAIIERPFVPGTCLDKFEEEFWPRIEAIIDEHDARFNPKPIEADHSYE